MRGRPARDRVGHGWERPFSELPFPIEGCQYVLALALERRNSWGDRGQVGSGKRADVMEGDDEIE
ncbi:hypothetical protein CKO16_21920 [Rhodoblastus acidophilus]|nr:hypothetical protein CKO16_21920 [Rhodoblastus acidophilus]